MRRLCLTLCILALPTLVSAQTHPCDSPAVVTGAVTVGQSGTLNTCQDGKDTNGNATTITALAMYDNGTRTTPTFTVGGPASTVSGKVEYKVAYTVPNVTGVHTIQFAAVSAKGEGPKSSVPFVLTVSLPQTVPTAPINQSLSFP